MAVKERSVSRIPEKRFRDPELDEVINTHKDVYILNDKGVIKEDKHPDVREYELTEDNFITREAAETKNRELEEKVSRKYDQALINEKKKQARKLTGRRVFETVVMLLLVVFVSAFLILLMYPQTQLAEMSRDNSDAKDRITLLKNQILDAEEEANGISDMDHIRAKALALGMQDPNQNQVVNLPIPSNDSLKTVVAYDAYGVSEEALENAVADLADYYRSHPDQGN